MTVPVTIALSEIRWEAPSDEELARSVALALTAVCGLKAMELSIGGDAWVVVKDREVRAVEASPPDEWTTATRPRSGWGARDAIGAEVGASRRTAVPLRCRHTEAYVVLWTSRATVTRELGEMLAESLGLAVDARVLVHRVAKLSRTAHSDNRRLRRTLRETLGADETMRSPAMRRCLERVHAVAAYDTPVLVTGPSGAGKELVARRIHAMSPRSNGPFVELNCGAIPESLAESELFGHRRGAFTGATVDRDGVFARARGGTLLLDEVGELPKSTQVKLLRVLQEGTFTPIGAERTQRTDARVIAATHRDLAARVRDGAFREDLFYRLAVFEVRVPSLVERPEDFPRLVRHILARVAARMGRLPPSVPRPVMARLAAHDWPGNVRELENALEGALVMSKGASLEVPLLLGPQTRSPTLSDRVEPLDVTIRAAIEAALRRTKGKIYGEGGAAQLLELKPGTLQSKMRKLGIERSDFL